MSLNGNTDQMETQSFQGQSINPLYSGLERTSRGQAPSATGKRVSEEISEVRGSLQSGIWTTAIPHMSSGGTV